MGIPTPTRVRTTLDYVRALELELTKIQAFHRELPLSFDLVTRTIETCRREVMESVEDGPVFEEFIPVNGSLDYDGTDRSERSDVGEAQDKMDWLRSAQLWNQHQLLEQSNDVDVEGVELCEGTVGIEGEASDAGSDEGGRVVGGAGAEEERMKKARRCWSGDLHRKFLSALEELGGPEVATPKQIKELMNVDGLTNDEIKSHLQKHRIRSKRPAAGLTTPVATGVINNNQPQVLFGIWVPQGDYAAVAAAAAAAIASLPLEPKPKKQRRQRQPKNNGTALFNSTSTGSNTTTI